MLFNIYTFREPKSSPLDRVREDWKDLHYVIVYVMPVRKACWGGCWCIGAQTTFRCLFL